MLLIRASNARRDQIGIRRIDQSRDGDDHCEASLACRIRTVDRAARAGTRGSEEQDTEKDAHHGEYAAELVRMAVHSRSMPCMDLGAQLAGSRVVIVAGKGGVGKTTATAALAVAAADSGANVLIAQVDTRPGLVEAFGRSAIGYDEIELIPKVRARALAPDEALVEYLEDHGMRRIARTLARTGALEVVATAVPGIRDLLVLGKIKQLEQSSAADVIVVDAPAAGHARTFLTSPIGLANAARVGPIRQQALEVQAMLADAARASLVLVTLPEATPVTECVETAYDIEDRVGIALGPVIVNGCTPDQRTLDAQWPRVIATTATAILEDAARAEVRIDDPIALAEACTYHDARVQREVEQCNRLTRLLPLPQIRLPRLADPVDLDGLRALAAQIPYGSPS